MHRTVARIALMLLAVGLFSAVTFAGSIPIGILSFDNTSPGFDQFDIANQTGPNSSVFPDTTFPVSTSVNLSSLSLTVNFVGGSSTTFGSGFFSLEPDGLSFTGPVLPTSGPGVLSAILTGMLSPLTVTLNSGATVTLNPTFSATLTDATGGPLVDGDFAIINATTKSSGVTPEPGTLLLLGSGLTGLIALRRRYL